jgi:phosphoglycolate phosphatase
VIVVLFDIDGTLIRTGRAGSRAMDRAFNDLFGIPGAFAGIQMAGRTDKWILEEAAGRSRVELDGSSMRRFRDRYSARLLEAIAEPAAGKTVLPGVTDLLHALASRSDMFLGLLTGNSEEGARIKLEHFDLWKFFRCGAFGDDVHDRNDLFAVAVDRVEASGAPRVPPHNVIVVGDTVLDVACAKAAGARSVAVATGPSDVEALRLSGADIAVEDLSDTGAFLRFAGVQI